MKHLGLPAALCLMFTMIGTAWGDVIHYHGSHPLPQGHQGLCVIEGPHVHQYQPHKPILYVKSGVNWVFVGDPVEFEPETNKHTYYGHHPVFWDHAHGAPIEVEHYCYITGPHHHLYAPPPKIEFKLKGGAYWYVGAHPGWYKKRRRKHRYIDHHYATVSLHRPVISVEPPAGFLGVVVGPHGHVHGGVHVASPRVQVNLPIPSLHVTIGGGGGVRHSHRHSVVGHGSRKYKDKHRRRHIRGGGPPGHAPAWGHRKHKGKGKGKKRK